VWNCAQHAYLQLTFLRKRPSREITGEVADPCKTRKKTPVQRVRCFSALSSGLTPPPPPMKNARRAAAAGHKTTQRRRRPRVRRRTALVQDLLGVYIRLWNYQFIVSGETLNYHSRWRLKRWVTFSYERNHRVFKVNFSRNAVCQKCQPYTFVCCKVSWKFFAAIFH